MDPSLLFPFLSSSPPGKTQEVPGHCWGLNNSWGYWCQDSVQRCDPILLFAASTNHALPVIFGKPIISYLTICHIDDTRSPGHDIFPMTKATFYMKSHSTTHGKCHNHDTALGKCCNFTTLPIGWIINYDTISWQSQKSTLACKFLESSCRIYMPIFCSDYVIIY